MDETVMGCIVAGTAVFIAIPVILKLYICERERNRVLQNLREQTAVYKSRTRS
jgi:hypothetical protein